MSNFTEIYDHYLGPVNIEVWPTETAGPAPITIEAAGFFAWLVLKGYATDYHFVDQRLIAIDVTPDNEFPIWETWAEWWADPRVISQPGKFTSTTNLLDALLCEYLNDPTNVRFTDCRTVADLPTEFLTAAEKAAKQ